MACKPTEHLFSFEFIREKEEKKKMRWKRGGGKGGWGGGGGGGGGSRVLNLLQKRECRFYGALFSIKGLEKGGMMPKDEQHD